MLAVILIDPHPSRLLSYSASDPSDSKNIHLKNFEPPYNRGYREIILNSSKDKITQPHERSIFEAVAKAYDNVPLEYSDDPLSATCIVRNCIRAVWEQRVFWYESEVLMAVFST